MVSSSLWPNQVNGKNIWTTSVIYKKIVIIGGNGFLGRSLTKYFLHKAAAIVIISRRPVETSKTVKWQAWDGARVGDWEQVLENADAVINLAGKNVDCRYTEKNKNEILDSRLQSTQMIGEAIRRSQAPPAIWINASSATIYNASFDKLMTETSGDIGDDFSMTVCKRWEEMANSFSDLQTRRLIMRISIVLGWDGAALPALNRLVKFGLGGKQGSGKQLCSWIHVDDFCRAVEWLIQNPSAEGTYNLTAPVPLTNVEFMRTLRTSLNSSFGLPCPEWLLTFGAFFIRTEPELVLKSRNVYPKRLLDEGFVFQYQDLEQAMEDLSTHR
jgi:uncharacterized protein